MSSPIFSTPTALNIDIPGTAGSFSICRRGSTSQVVDVQYLLTHVALGAGGSQGRLLDMLAPVREVFDIDQLDFNEIMQRDIDDARVAMDLIPYLLDHGNSGLVKLFPPIVVVVLPLQETSRRPDHHYAKVSTVREPEPRQEGFQWERTTAGPKGKEQFQIARLLREDGTVEPAHSQLRLAQGNCALAIVDGQHRAMALLALYRNLTGGWSDARRAVYQQYYRVWSEDEIRNFDTSDLQMPMIICTFPQLDEDYSGNMDVIRAARRVFLDLNKNAKKVSDSRNKLLDDQDIVSECLRSVLAKIKGYDVNSQTPLRIANVELDQAQDRSVISSPMALTGVSHLYYIAEHLLFYSSFTSDTGPRRANLGRSRHMDEAYTRLGLTDELTSQEQDDNTRKNYTDKVARTVEAKWEQKYGTQIELILAKFHPFSAHAQASLHVRERLRAANDLKLLSLLFDGQASSRTFQDFEERLDLNIKFESNWATPELKAILADVRAQINQYEREVATFKEKRAEIYISSVRGPGSRAVRGSGDEASAVAVDIVNQLYQQVFTSIAFQAAVVLTLIEGYERRHDAAEGDVHQITEAEVTAYLADLEALFKPTSLQKFMALSATFFDQLREGDDGLQRVPTSANFSGVVMPSEMKPDEWPKYRYLILELWQPSEPDLKAIVDADREVCRLSVLRAAFRRALLSYCEEHQVREEGVGSSVKRGLLEAAMGNYEQFLESVVGRSLSLASVSAKVEQQLGMASEEEIEGADAEAP